MTDAPVFKLIIAGGRWFRDYDQLAREARRLIDGRRVEIVSGMAKGADSLAIQFARENNIPTHGFPADWIQHGKSAGFKRNVQMADFADGLLAFWDGQSRGTKHMINTMRRLNKPVRVIKYRSDWL